ncbi:MAG: hypothetical protein ACLR8U_02060 [Oscillospiraceae bacterium]
MEIIFLSIPSVGATENLLLACALMNGTVTLHGAAREPEITDLIGFLRAAGAEYPGRRVGRPSPSAESKAPRRDVYDPTGPY